MKQKTKNELLTMTAIDAIKKTSLAVLLLLCGAGIGYVSSNKECKPCPVGFASLEDMRYLVIELRECENSDRYH